MCSCSYNYKYTCLLRLLKLPNISFDASLCTLYNATCSVLLNSVFNHLVLSIEKTQLDMSAHFIQLHSRLRVLFQF